MPDIIKILLRSGPCFDTVPALRLYLAALDCPFLRPLALLSRVKFSPLVLDAVRASGLPDAERSRLFSAAMNLFRSGPSYKTTSAGRTPLTDAAIIKRLAPGRLALETGVSDGISALALLDGANGAEVLLSDAQAAFQVATRGPLAFCYGMEGGLLFVKLPGFLFCCGDKAEPPAGARTVSLLNPALEARGLALLRFDIFTSALPRKADVIKCANVLNLEYFSAGEIAAAVRNLAANLAEGGWLFIAQNSPRYPGGEAYLALQKTPAGLELREEANSHDLLATPEIWRPDGALPE